MSCPSSSTRTWASIGISSIVGVIVRISSSTDVFLSWLLQLRRPGLPSGLCLEQPTWTPCRHRSQGPRIPLHQRRCSELPLPVAVSRDPWGHMPPLIHSTARIISSQPTLNNFLTSLICSPNVVELLDFDIEASSLLASTAASASSSGAPGLWLRCVSAASTKWSFQRSVLSWSKFQTTIRAPKVVVMQLIKEVFIAKTVLEWSRSFHSDVLEHESVWRVPMSRDWTIRTPEFSEWSSRGIKSQQDLIHFQCPVSNFCNSMPRKSINLLLSRKVWRCRNNKHFIITTLVPETGWMWSLWTTW